MRCGFWWPLEMISYQLSWVLSNFESIEELKRLNRCIWWLHFGELPSLELFFELFSTNCKLFALMTKIYRWSDTKLTIFINFCRQVQSLLSLLKNGRQNLQKGYAISFMRGTFGWDWQSYYQKNRFKDPHDHFHDKKWLFIQQSCEGWSLSRWIWNHLPCIYCRVDEQYLSVL